MNDYWLIMFLKPKARILGHTRCRMHHKTKKEGRCQVETFTKDGKDADTSKGKSGGQDPGGVRRRVDRRVLLLCPLS